MSLLDFHSTSNKHRYVKKKSGPESEQEDNDNSDVSENTSTWDYINIEGEGEEKYLCLMTPHAEVVQKLYLVLTFSVAREMVIDHPLDTITLTGPLLYMTPQGERKLGTKAVKDELPENCYNADNRDLDFPPDASISVGVQYDYKLMPDYGKKLFALNKPCLLQPNWHKLNGELIVPWKNYQQLRPGTVVVANVSFRLHVLQPKDKTQRKWKILKSQTGPPNFQTFTHIATI
ncbi:hypothetical protein C8R41DRAFT_871932 [Lentinula lateritia]|uniref:DUF1769-domain-containing protein n=1 Tax=Lentinula lateritia TaxID=40482 RepID=A0ABQ8UZB8_9AGAR|nr:hypothetical protein C8R41DRAFT_871932 [Lentinula lateritia]